MQGKVKVGAALSAPISCPSRTQTVGVGERNHGEVCTAWPDLTELVRGARMPPAARLRPRFARKELTELVCGRRRWACCGVLASTRRLHELNYRQTVLPIS